MSNGLHTAIRSGILLLNYICNGGQYLQVGLGIRSSFTKPSSSGHCSYINVSANYMSTGFNQNDHLTIQLLRFDMPARLIERYYFLEMSTLQVTSLLNTGRKIISSTTTASTADNSYLDEVTNASFKTIGDFNEFFAKNPSYYIYDCEIKFENGTIISSHDDGEVSVQFATDDADRSLIDQIFETHDLDKGLIEQLRERPGHYIRIDSQGNITGDFEDFDEYIKSGRA